VKVDGHLRVGRKNEIPYYRHSNYGDIEKIVNNALNIGADAIGMTFYVGGEETEEDVERIGEIIEEAHGCGLPAVVWGYARGPLPEKVGADSLYWCHVAVSAAEDLGADIVKTKFPRPARNLKEYKRMMTGDENEKGFVEAKMPEAPEMYLDLEPEKGKTIPYDLHVKRMNLVVSPAKRTFVVVSGGPRLGVNPEEELRETTRIVMDAGAEGRIIGRNFWGRPIKEAKSFTNLVAEVMKDQRYDRKLKEPRFDINYS
jgi:class I fructose-bisphosphate aldolase